MTKTNHKREMTMKTTKYLVTKLFIGGLLNGLTIEEETTCCYRVGFVCKNPIGGSPYKIIAVVETY